MNRQYAIEIIEMIERGTADKNDSLSKEAIRYLKKLKSTTTEILDRIYKIEYGK